ncbi:MAG TPA: hypothetical protein VGI75_13455, partial [Pirellulales bacterium]
STDRFLRPFWPKPTGINHVRTYARTTQKRYGKTTLNGGINTTVMTITATDGSVFPSTGNFRRKIDDELNCTSL